MSIATCPFCGFTLAPGAEVPNAPTTACIDNWRQKAEMVEEERDALALMLTQTRDALALSREHLPSKNALPNIQTSVGDAVNAADAALALAEPDAVAKIRADRERVRALEAENETARAWKKLVLDALENGADEDVWPAGLLAGEAVERLVRRVRALEHVAKAARLTYDGGHKTPLLHAALRALDDGELCSPLREIEDFPGGGES